MCLLVLHWKICPKQTRSSTTCKECRVNMWSEEDMVRALAALGLEDIDLGSCEVSLQWKEKLL